MSKSLGNFHTLRDILNKGYSGRETRFVLIAGHYRQSLNFSFDALGAARSALQRLDEFQERLGDTVPSNGSTALPDWAETARKKFDAALTEDLNIAESLGALFDMVHAGNKAMDAGLLGKEQAGAVRGLMAGFDRVLGFLEKPPESAPEEALRLLEQRQAARQAKNWPEADRVRNELAVIGWVIQDTPQGPKLKKK
jgi:cysteinyl-tRNA synthetase